MRPVQNWPSVDISQYSPKPAWTIYLENIGLAPKHTDRLTLVIGPVSCLSHVIIGNMKVYHDKQANL